MVKLSADYIAGFVDGEGCFALKFRREIRRERKGAPEYFYWDIEFAIVLREDDREILERIKETFGCGRMSISKSGQARYAVNDISDLNDKIVPFFDRYRLQAKKKHDFQLWKEAVAIIKMNQRLNLNRRAGDRYFHKTNWDIKDLKRLEEIHRAMKSYKSHGKEWKWIGKNGFVRRYNSP